MCKFVIGPIYTIGALAISDFEHEVVAAAIVGERYYCFTNAIEISGFFPEAPGTVRLN
jgi:hypothetical protein